MFARFWTRIAKRRARGGGPPCRTGCWPCNCYQRGVPLEVVENAFVLAAARRLMRPADAPPLGTIRSLAYFPPVIEEVLQLRVSPEYFQYLRHKLQRAASAR